VVTTQGGLRQFREDSFSDGDYDMPELTLEEKIRERAYQLWQLDGSLEGCADEYWRMARALVEEEIGPPTAPLPLHPDPATPR
jgi:hypothetical protein